MADGELLGRTDDPDARRTHALDLAFRRLGQRDRTVAEMRRHLEAKRVEPATIEAVVGELQAGGYLDDTGYARRFAEDRRRLDGWGAERIERRLRALGVAPADVAAALGPRDDDGELQAALEVLRRRVHTAPRDDRGRERALAILARRGYDLEVAYAAVRRFEREP